MEEEKCSSKGWENEGGKNEGVIKGRATGIDTPNREGKIRLSNISERRRDEGKCGRVSDLGVDGLGGGIEGVQQVSDV